MEHRVSLECLDCLAHEEDKAAMEMREHQAFLERLESLDP